MASLALTAGLLCVMILSLASRDGARGRDRDAALHAFAVAAPARISDRATSAHAPAPARQSPEASPRLRTQIASKQSPGAIAVEARFSFDGPAVPALETRANDAASTARNAANPAIAPQQSVEASGLSASVPRAEGDSYSTLILAWLKRHQHFPEGQVRDAIDATVLIAFTVDRRGRAGDVRVVRGSGIAWLDALALRQVRRASPFPRPRRGAPDAALSFEIPMRYRARG